jgi:ArsR family transcriptional regulator
MLCDMITSTRVDMTESPIILMEKGAICETTRAPTVNDAQVVLPLLKIMSEPNRLKIYSFLAAGERCVCDIEAFVKLPQNLVSHHLGVLRDGGFIRARRDGRWVHYSINKVTLAGIYPVLCRLFNPECVSVQPGCDGPGCS